MAVANHVSLRNAESGNILLCDYLIISITNFDVPNSAYLYDKQSLVFYVIFQYFILILDILIIFLMKNFYSIVFYKFQIIFICHFSCVLSLFMEQQHGSHKEYGSHI